MGELFRAADQRFIAGLNPIECDGAGRIDPPFDGDAAVGTGEGAMLGGVCR